MKRSEKRKKRRGIMVVSAVDIYGHETVHEMDLNAMGLPKEAQKEIEAESVGTPWVMFGEASEVLASARERGLL